MTAVYAVFVLFCHYAFRVFCGLWFLILELPSLFLHLFFFYSKILPFQFIYSCRLLKFLLSKYSCVLHTDITSIYIILFYIFCGWIFFFSVFDLWSTLTVKYHCNLQFLLELPYITYHCNLSILQISHFFSLKNHITFLIRKCIVHSTVSLFLFFFFSADLNS